MHYPTIPVHYSVRSVTLFQTDYYSLNTHACVVQLVVSMGLLFALGEVSRWTGALSFVPPVHIEMSKSLAIAPVTALFVAMLSFTNYCLRHVDIGFYQVQGIASSSSFFVQNLAVYCTIKTSKNSN